VGRVTDADPRRLAAVLAGLSLEELESFAGLGERDPEERAAWKRRREALQGATHCGQCRKPLEGTIYRFAVWGSELGVRCEDCIPQYIRDRRGKDGWTQGHYVEGACEICRRMVVRKMARQNYYSHRHIFCSERCRTEHYTRTRRAARAVAREKACETCGAPFTGTRRDARHCSSACRQKAYRERRKSRVEVQVQG
jgi:hypothetical protein